MLHVEPSSARGARPRPGHRGAARLAALGGIACSSLDDDTDALELFATVLRHAGAEVRTSRGRWREAIGHPPGVGARRRSSPTSRCPSENGYAFIRRLRGGDVPNGERIPAVAVTAYGGVERADQDRVGRVRFLRRQAGRARRARRHHRPSGHARPRHPARPRGVNGSHEALRRSVRHRRRHHAEPAVHQHAAGGHAAPARSRLLAGVERATRACTPAPTSTRRCTCSRTASPPPRSASTRSWARRSWWISRSSAPTTRSRSTISSAAAPTT